MKNVIDSIRVQIHERLSSPLFGSFVLAWACWNHRFLVALFSSLPVDKKFEYIDANIYSTNQVIWLHCLIGPVLTAILFIYLYPIISKHFFGYWLRQQKKLKELRDNIEGSTLLTVEESHAIRLEIIKARDEFDETIKRQAAEIEALKKTPKGEGLAEELRRKEASDYQRKLDETLTRQSKETNELKAQIEQLLKRQSEVPKKTADENQASKPAAQVTVEKGTITLIEILAKSDGELVDQKVFEEFTNRFKDSKVRVQYYIDEAKRLNLISIDRKIRGDAYFTLYTLTETGRRFAVQQSFA